MSSAYMKELIRADRRIMFCVHRQELIEQTQQKLEGYGLPHGFIKAGYSEDRSAPVQLASIQSLAYRTWWKHSHFDVIIFDEGHETAWSKVAKRLMKETHPNACFVNLTGTPWRTSKREGYGDVFPEEQAVFSPMPHELMQMGYLSPFKAYYGIPQADLSGVCKQAGDYKESDLSNACDRPELVQRAVQEWFRLGEGRRTLAFCVDVEHAQNVAAEFRAHGVPAAHIEGSMDLQKERKPIYQALAAAELLVVSAVNCLSVGFDRPEVSCGLLLRPTQSRALHFQQTGRLMRISPETGKEDSIIIDQAGNVSRFGFVEDLTEIKFDQGVPVKGDPPTKECPECHRFVRIQESKCQCGYVWPPSEETDSDRAIYEGELVLLRRKEELKAQTKSLSPEMKKQRTAFRRCIKDAYKNGWSPGKAYFDYKRKFKMEPRHSWSLHAVFGPDFSSQNVSDYWNRLAESARRLNKPVAWVKRYMTFEFGEGWNAFLRLKA